MNAPSRTPALRALPARRLRQGALRPVVLRPPVARSAAVRWQSPIAATRPIHWQPVRWAPFVWPESGVVGDEPYVGFSRRFTPEGGIEFGFRAIDERFWRKWLQALGFLTAMTATLLLFLLAPPNLLIPMGCGAGEMCIGRMPWWQVLALLLGVGFSAWAFALICFRPMFCEATLEIRQDCMILDRSEVFWRKYMDLGPPAVVPDADGSHLLQGIYGSRFVVYARLMREEEEDRFPELLGQQLQMAIAQLWRE